MRAVRLQANLCDDLGEIGLRLRGIPPDTALATVFSGGGVAHDIVEHSTDARRIGSLWEEVLAFGGVWYTQGVLGQLGLNNPYRCPLVSLGEELFDFLEYTEDIDRERAVFEEFAHCYQSREFREEFQAIHASAVKASKERGDPLSEPHQRCLDLLPLLLAKGAQRSHRRFGNPITAHNTFYRIKAAVEPLFRHELIEGDEYLLTFSHYEAQIRLLDTVQ